LISFGIHAFLERLDPDAAHGIDEQLVLVPARTLGEVLMGT
jgi:hypothetical protein